MTASRPPCGPDALLDAFDRIDIYVFDQLLRGRITPAMRILDAGCGAGRNSAYLMACGADVWGVDADPAQIDRVRALAARVAPSLGSDRFQVGRLADLPHAAGSFDVVICSAVLHFARDTPELEAMISEMWRVLSPGGVFFARLASSIGIESEVVPLRDRWHRLPDGSDRFLVDEAYLMEATSRRDAELLDPLKTTVVQGMRAMTTWVLRKRRPPDVR